MPSLLLPLLLVSLFANSVPFFSLFHCIFLILCYLPYFLLHNWPGLLSVLRGVLHCGTDRRGSRASLAQRWRGQEVLALVSPSVPWAWSPALCLSANAVWGVNGRGGLVNGMQMSALIVQQSLVYHSVLIFY